MTKEKSEVSESQESVIKEKQTLEPIPKANSQNQQKHQVSLIKVKLDNVLKEKFTSIDLVAEENSKKIFEDFNFLENSFVTIQSVISVFIPLRDM